MHSKLQIWDFFSSYKRDFLKSFQGIVAINTFDPVCLKLVKDYLTKELYDKVIYYKMSEDVTKAWIENEFQTLSLFTNTDNFFIHQAQDLPLDVLANLSDTTIADRFVILSFEDDQAAWKKLVKDNKFSTIMIEPPKFWENNKLLDFICSYFRLSINHQAKLWILESQENNLTSFYNVCSLIKINFPDSKEVKLDDLKSLLTQERLDQFNLANLFGRKKFKEFFEKLRLLEGDFEKMRTFFNFMQNHLVKMADTSYLADKNRPNQYDRELQASSKLWKTEEIITEVEKFNRWEICCKRKDPFIWHEIKEDYLRARYL